MNLAIANSLVAYGTLVLQAVTIALLFAYIFRMRSESIRCFLQVLAPHGLLLACAASLVGSVLTVYYSSVLGIDPCPLCWWQRAMLYPQVVLLGLASWRKDTHVAMYSIALSGIGFAVAVYQHVLQMLPGSGLPCPAMGVSCAQRFLFEFGYITYPLAAVTLFAFLIVLMLIVRRK